jgi:WD40 repeat protein
MVSATTLKEPVFQILLLDVETGREPRELCLSGRDVAQVKNVAFSRDGAVLVASSWDRRLTVWNAHTGELIRATRRHSAWASPMVFSPDGQLLAVGTINGAIVFWRLDDLLGSGEPREALTLLALDAGTQWLAYTPDGYYDCSAGAADCLLWRRGSEFLTVNQAASEYHRPDLLAKALAP